MRQKQYKIEDKLEKRYDELSEEQAERYSEITFEYIGNATDELDE